MNFTERSINTETGLYFLVVVFFIGAISPMQVLANGNGTSFKKTDISLLDEIETNKTKFTRLNYGSKAVRRQPPKQRRFEIAKKGIQKLIYKNSVPNSLLGGVLGAVATAHPTGLVLGGFAGILQGKSDRYEEAQGKIYEMKKEIFASQNKLTSEEIRLATYTGADLSEFMPVEANLPPAKEDEANLQQKDQLNASEVTALSQNNSTPVDLDYCHDLSMGNTKPVDTITRRQLVELCFYHMN